jgi:hypothetical protein
MWLLKITADLLGSLAAMVLAPIVVRYADKYTGRLPRAFWWMETPDNLLPGDLKEPKVKRIYDRFGWYWTAVYWLGWRNKAYGLSMALAFRPNKSMRMSWRGQRDVSDDNDKRGWAWFRLGPAWEFYAVYGRRFGVRFRIGYKLQPFFQSPDWSNPLWGMPVLHLSLRKLG